MSWSGTRAASELASAHEREREIQRSLEHMAASTGGVQAHMRKERLSKGSFFRTQPRQDFNASLRRGSPRAREAGRQVIVLPPGAGAAPAPAAGGAGKRTAGETATSAMSSYTGAAEAVYDDMALASVYVAAAPRVSASPKRFKGVGVASRVASDRRAVGGFDFNTSSNWGSQERERTLWN